MRGVLLLAAATLVIGSQPMVPANATNANGKWTLTFSDEFNSLDRAKWRILNDCSTTNKCVYNNELQVYLASQVSVSKGNLVIEANNVPYVSPSAGARRYRSGRMDTSGSFAQLHGRFEARVKLPSGQGMWPAFWMMPRGGRCWPMDGEIDVLEYIGKRMPHTVHDLHSSANYCGVTGGAKTLALNTNDFHIYAVEWTPTSLAWFVDGVQYFKIDATQCRTKPAQLIPTKPFYLILNFAVGGDWPGNPDATSTFPQRLYVDYVRVYKRSVL
ncbi:hypothetical protein SPRG_07386 [Saprolegnia parasitica CBS 223.65]|uniref:GH16 domain-containing protein n=1 Tax=Saprolegnia parasitica (strain CBS 223.65) TaxID=695850 RepID=A0A067CLV1_SAPPC|nr:hypothetical protein SPRG_07386 [Saprolegnia parasitica CBS 223.65]KDO27787.1 hypothetical protein SPRG_07386 [Saprolegnia parasitica CBS 223.65]|eukprot:XP_012201562.1 hypothetical protein SPRG_07386 [Saprolegnia parasitica CBS 223.65]